VSRRQLTVAVVTRIAVEGRWLEAAGADPSHRCRVIAVSGAGYDMADRGLTMADLCRL